jgi:hypothetical protein
MKVKYFDPPSGWKYGYPMRLPDSINTTEDIIAWLVENGYPEKDVEIAVRYGRWWEEEVEDD